MWGLSFPRLWYSGDMASGKHIRAVGQKAAIKAQSDTGSTADGADLSEGVDFADAIEPEDELDLAQYDLDEGDEVQSVSPRLSWLAPALAILAVVSWTGFYGWAMQNQLSNAAATPSDWTRLLVDWSVPILLIGVSWLLAMRHSRAEANRFAQSAALLSQESRELESRLTVVNRELSLAREFLSAQSRELESLGRMASERISAHADTLQGLIKTNGKQVDAIGNASESALANMTRLRDDLPVVANSARDVSNQVGAAGRTAHDNLERLVTSFDRLNEFGRASETQVTSVEGRVGEVLTRFEEQISGIEDRAGMKLEDVKASTEEYRGEVEGAETAALQALTERVSALKTETQEMGSQLRESEEQAMARLDASKERFSDEVVKAINWLDEVDAKAINLAQKRVDDLNAKVAVFVDQLETRDRQFNEQVVRVQEEFSTNEAQASEVLSQRLADLDDALSQRRQAHIAETDKLVSHSAELNEKIEQLSGLITQATQQSGSAEAILASGLDSLDGQIDAKREKLRQTQDEINELTESGVRLLEIIQSSATFTREDLPEAMKETLGTLSNVEERALEVSTLMLATSEKADALTNYLIEARGKVDENDASIEALHFKTAENSEEALARIQGLQSGLARLAEESETVAGATQERLREELTKLDIATKEVFETLDTGAREKVTALADSLSKQAVEDLERSLRNNSAEAAGKLEQAAAHASGVGREATVQLRDQLAKVNELTKNLEQRIARSRELAEEQVNNDFARRMALITDSLNSSAIDLTSALSHEVSDTSWDDYLKGDRGIFTRRAVRLIDNGNAREIADLYQSDDEFRANVSRYIHDFEAMLRSVLSTRDGKALGVTILGSDVGKLYVVLAQSIERLRQ
ncbi:MAG: ATPase [Erythrobacter sp.]|uniref:ATPase n=1 Tax=Erythrobacter sp. TaxID=1042 RepID=UPI0032648762